MHRTSARACAVGFIAIAACAAGLVWADPLFESDTILKVTLSGPFQKLSRDRSIEPEERPGTVTFVDIDGSEKSLAVELAPRGKSRRDREVCTFPPLRLDFVKSEARDTLFDKQNALKLVTHCRKTESFQNYVLKEYLAYRIFNLITDTSFRVRLLEIAYVDADRPGSDPLVRYGFLIEHKKRLAKRLGLDLVDIDRVHADQHDPLAAAIAELYMFLVSNTDFSFIAGPEGEYCCHNAILLAGTDGSFLPVPYDFDRTGLVDPPNGLPAEELGQRNFRDRLYRGFCRPEEVMREALARTQRVQAQAMALIDSMQGLSASHRSRAAGFVEEFYEIIGDDARRARELKCRSPM